MTLTEQVNTFVREHGKYDPNGKISKGQWGVLWLKFHSDRINSGQLNIINRSYMIGIGVSEWAVNRLDAAGYLDKFLISKCEKTILDKIYNRIVDDEETSTRAKLKLGKNKNDLSRIVRQSKESKEEVNDLILEFFNNMGEFEVKYHTNGYNWLCMWDDNGDRIYHSRGFKTKKRAQI